MPRFLPALALAAMVWCAYYPATTAEFIWDDNDHIVEDPLINAPDGLSSIWFKPGVSAWNYWPLTRSTFWLEGRLWGIEAGSTHIFNVCLHLTSVLILYFGLLRFRVPQAWFIAGLLALHPVFVDSVTLVTERKNTLSIIYYLLCIWSYLLFDENRKWRWYVFALFLFGCALLSKSSTIMLPVILIFCRFALRRPWEKRDVLRLIPFFALSIAAGLVSIWFEENIIGSHGADFDRSLAERFAVAGRIPFAYLRRLLVPWPLIFVYPRWNIATGNPLAYLPLAAVIAIALGLFSKYKTTWGRPLFLGLGAFLVTLFPVLSLFDINGMRFSFIANHWVHLPALPILILIGAGLGSWLKKAPTIRRLALTVILAICGILTWQRNQVFQNPETLWTDTIAKNPACWMARNNLGVYLDARGRRDEAITHFEEAIRLKPDYDEAHYNLGNAAFHQRRVDDAIWHYSETLRIDPYSTAAHTNLGTALMFKGQMDKALFHYTEAVRIKPDFAEGHNNLGNAFMQLERIDEALPHLMESVRLNANNEKAQYNLGFALAKKGRFDEAIPHYVAALTLNPDYAKAHNSLGAALVQSGNINAAVPHFQEALRIDPAFSEARENLTKALTPQTQEQ